jgi:hypothetical protein
MREEEKEANEGEKKHNSNKLLKKVGLESVASKIALHDVEQQL